MEQMRIFLSHSSADNDFADALAKALRGAGADVWYDETHLGTGRLLREISRQLANRPVFIVILSKEAFASHWVPRECEWAYDLYNNESDRTILPIIAGSLDMRDWHGMLWLREFRRISRAGGEPFPQDKAISLTLRLLKLTPADGSLVSIKSLSELSDSFRAELAASIRSSQRNIGTHPSTVNSFEQMPPPGSSIDNLEKEPLQSLSESKYAPTWSTQASQFTGSIEPLEIVCASCGAKNSPGVSICENCGTPLTS